MASHARVLSFLAVMSTATPVVAGGFGIPEVGVRRTGMATIIGRPDDASAIYHNPAGLILQHDAGLYISLGLSMIDTEFRLQPWDQSDRFLGTSPESDGYYAPVKPTRAMGVIPMIAATYEVLPDKLVLGTAIFVGNATGAQFEEQAVTRYHLIDGYVVAPQAVLAASYRVHPTLSLGASVGVLNLRVHGKREVFPIVNGMDVSMITGTRPELTLDGSGWAPTWMLGAFGQPHPRITWGATITGRVDAELTGPISVKYSDDSPAPGDMLKGSQTTTQMLPWAFMGGANFDVHENVELGTEFRYWLYRQYKKQHTDVVGIFLVRELETMKNYNDSWAVSAGARVHSLDFAPKLELMAGAQYDKSPAPKQTVTLDQPSFSHPAAHLGVRYSAGRYRFGASYIHYWYLIPKIEDSITGPPSNIKGSGSNNIFTVSVEATL
ncbi:MAG: outer membrane protein transport protein [Myxococcota bacterium]|nr:outer membrane protein transport protein [Deltaproteobacteria bacterium]MDQ3333898.1 outer membrane protein transport protein [Myxococcota bacterium]